MDSKQIELHYFDFQSTMSNIEAICQEHGLGGIVTMPCNLKNASKDNVLISAIDIPFGIMSTDARIYSIISAKEHGAVGVEMAVQYPYMIYNDLTSIEKDIASIKAASEETKIEVRYVIDLDVVEISNDVYLKYLQLLSVYGINKVSISSGFSINKDKNYQDLSKKIKLVKEFGKFNIKTAVWETDPKIFYMYKSLGIDIFGVDWRRAPFIINEYEDFVKSR